METVNSQEKNITKITNSQEEYLKTIFILEKNNKKVRVTDIAEKLHITKPSVNKAINILKDMELINYKIYGDIKLTQQGEKLAKEIIKKHDILKMFLSDVLEVEPNKAEEEAKQMKYAISEDTAKKLDQYIGKIFDLGDLNCNYDSNSEKCRNCVKITAKNRLKNYQFGDASKMGKNA